MTVRTAANVFTRIAQTARQGKALCAEVSARIKCWAVEKDLGQQAFLVAIIVGLSVCSWCLGRLSADEAQGPASSSVVIKDVFDDARERFTCRPQKPDGGGEEGTRAPTRPEGSVVASKNGSKYHLPRCPGANAIKEENKIWFDSETAAQSAGYTRAGNCK